MKIAVIGKGTSAIITALGLIKEGHDIEIFYDPESPHLSVGESTTPHIGELIESTLDFSIGRMSDRGIVSFKNGIKFIGWGNQQSFRHHFNNNSAAFHFETGVFNPFIHNLMEKNRGVVYHAERVEDYDIDVDIEKIIINDKQYDFMVNCSGWNDSNNYYEPYFPTVNSAILYTEDSVEDSTYTLHRATPHGWQFGLPFPDKGVTKCGYLFNSDYDKVEDVEKLFEGRDYKKISWKPKYHNKIIENRFVAYNGNRLFFFEPLQALSLLYYNSALDLIIRFLHQGRSTYSYYNLNKEYLDLIYEYHISLAFHYQYGSKYDSVFWNKTKESAFKYLNHNPKFRRESLYDQYYGDKISQRIDNDKESILSLGCFEGIDYRDIHGGMTGIDLDQIPDSDQDIFHYPTIEHKQDCNLEENN